MHSLQYFSLYDFQNFVYWSVLARIFESVYSYQVDHLILVALGHMTYLVFDKFLKLFLLGMGNSLQSEYLCLNPVRSSSFLLHPAVWEGGLCLRSGYEGTSLVSILGFNNC